MKLNYMERDAILAGLRLLQWKMETGELWSANPEPRLGDIRKIYNQGKRGLTAEEIDTLCERMSR